MLKLGAETDTNVAKKLLIISFNQIIILGISTCNTETHKQCHYYYL